MYRASVTPDMVQIWGSGMFSESIARLGKWFDTLTACLPAINWPKTASEWARDTGLTGLVLWLMAFGLIALLRGGSGLVTSRDDYWHRCCENLLRAEPSRSRTRKARRMVKHHFMRFASRWNSQFDMASPCQKEELRRLARESGLIDRAKDKLAVSRQQAELGSALRVLARVADPESSARAHEILLSSNPNLAYEAACYLMQVDAGQSIHEVLLRLVARPGWNPMQVRQILQGTPLEIVTSGFWSCMKVVPEINQTHLIPCLQFVDAATATFPLTRYLPLHRRDEWLVAALEQATAPELAPVIRQLLDHPAGSVRLASLKAICRLGDINDLPHLKDCLADSNWWVRHGAATSIVDWLGQDAAAIQECMASLSEPHAREVLSTVMAERQL